jgi:ribosomal protein S15P/S13E
MWYLLWLLSGLVGALIYNRTVTYETKTLKYILNAITILCGPAGLLIAILTWVDSLFPSPAPKETVQEKYDALCKEITRLQEKYDENGYDASPLIKLQRIESHIDSVINQYHKELDNNKKQSTIDSDKLKAVWNTNLNVNEVDSDFLK